MLRRRLYLASLLAFMLAAAIVAASSNRCTCVLGGNYQNTDDPADCSVHGSLEP